MKERKKKRKKFSWKRTLMYTTTYAVVTFCVALFMVLTSSTTLSSGNTISFTPYEPSAIERIIGSITESDDISIDVDVVVSKGADVVGNASLTAVVQMGEELSDIKVGADLTISNGEQDIAGNIFYGDGALYLSLLNADYSMSTGSLVEAVGQLGTLFGLDLGSLTEGLDTSALVDLGANIKPQPTLDGYSITIPVADINITILTDKDYNLQSIHMPNLAVGDYHLTVGAKVTSRNAEIELVAPDKEWVDLTESTRILGALSNTLQKGVYMQADVQFGTGAFNGYAQISGGDVTLFGSLDMGSAMINIALDNGYVYADVAGVKTKIKLADYKDYLQVLKLFGIEFNTDFDSIFNFISTLSINVIDSIESVDNNAIITLTNGTQIVFDLTDNELKSIAYATTDVQVTLGVHEGTVTAPVINGDEYFDAKQLLPLVPAIADVVKAKGLSGELNVNYNNNDYVVDYAVNFSNGISAQLSSTIEGYNVNVVLDQDIVYVALDNFKAQFALSELTTLMGDSNINIPLMVSTNEQDILLQLFEYGITLTTTESGVNINTTIDKFGISATLMADSPVISVEDKDSYKPLDVVSVVNNVTNIINNSKLSIVANVTVGKVNLPVNIALDFSNGLTANISTSYSGIDALVTIQNGQLYVDCNGFKMTAPLAKLPDVLSDILTTFGVQMPSTLPAIALGYDGGNVSINAGDLNAVVDIQNNFGHIELTYSTVSAIVDITSSSDIVVNTLSADEVATYTNDITNLTDIASAVYDLVTCNQMTAVLRLHINGKQYDFTLSYTHTDTYNVQLTGTFMDKPVLVSLVNDTVYLSVLGMNYYFDLQDWDKLRIAIKNFVGKDLSQMLDGMLSSLQGEKLDLSGVSFDASGIIARLGDVALKLSIDERKMDMLQVEYGNLMAFVYFKHNITSTITAPDKKDYTNLVTKLDVLTNVRKVLDSYELMKVPYMIEGKEYSGIRATSDIYVRFGTNIFTGNIEVFTVPTMVQGKVTNKVYVALDAYMKDFNVKLYLVDGTIYANVQGLKVSVPLNSTEIDYIIDFVNTTFGLNVKLDTSSGLTLTMPDLSTLSFDGDGNSMYAYLAKLEMGATRFENIELTIDTPDTLASLLLGTNVFDNNITDLGTGEFVAGEMENATTLNKNLVLALTDITLGGTSASIILGDTITVGGEELCAYTNYRNLINMVEGLLQYIDKGEFGFKLNATVTDKGKLFAEVKDAQVQLHNDTLSVDENGKTKRGIGVDYLYLNGALKLLNNSSSASNKEYITHNISGNYANNNLHVTYSNDVVVPENANENDKELRLKINKTAFKEVLAIALKVFAIDLGSLGKDLGLPKVDNLDVTNLQSMLNIKPAENSSSFDEINNMLADVALLLSKISSISYTHANANGKAVDTLVASIDINGTFMELTIRLVDGALNYVSVDNVSVSKDRTLTLTLDGTTFTRDNTYDTTNHFDLSNISDILTAFVNTSAFNDFRITGNLALKMEVIGISDLIDWAIPYDIRIQLVDNVLVDGVLKDNVPVVYAHLEVPVFGTNVNLPGINKINVNMDVPYELGDAPGTSTRYIDIMYKDGYVYTYRTEKVGGKNRTYEKALKQSLQTVTSDIMGYVQYAIGFTPEVMGAIEGAIAKSLNRTTPIDFTNVINNYGYNTNTLTHDVVLNLAELANNTDLDSGTINIHTGKPADTITDEGYKPADAIANKKYITQIDYDIFMPFADAFKMTLKSTDTKLVDIGHSVDMTKLNEFISNYAYGEDEYWEASNGNWTKASDKEYTITFDSQGGSAVPSITNKLGTPITLPTTLPNKVENANNVTTTYEFVAWYLTSDCTGEAVNYTTQPRGDVTLYAKWKKVSEVYTYTVTFNSNGGTGYEVVYVVQGNAIPNFSSYTPHRHDDCSMNDWGTKCTHTHYSFEGWYRDSGFTTKFNGTVNGNMTLYAKYTTSSETHRTAFGICDDNCYGC